MRTDVTVQMEKNAIQSTAIITHANQIAMTVDKQSSEMVVNAQTIVNAYQGSAVHQVRVNPNAV